MSNIRDRVQKLEALTNVVNLIDACGVTEAELPGIIENAIEDMEANVGALIGAGRSGELATPYPHRYPSRIACWSWLRNHYAATRQWLVRPTTGYFAVDGVVEFRFL